MAVAGFRVAFQKPVAILIWAAFALITALGSGVITVATMGPALAKIQSATPGDPQASLAALGQMGIGYAILLPCYLITSAITTVAANRAMLRPQERQFGYLRLGPDEFRVGVVLLVVGLIMGLLYIVSAIVFLGLGAFLGVVLAGHGEDPTGSVAGMSIGMLLGLIPAGLIMAFVASKFSLSSAVTLDTRSINIFGSWSLTRGRTGKVFLTYLLMLGLYVLVGLIAVSLMAGAVAAFGGGAAGMLKMFQPDMSTYKGLFAPITFTYYVLVALVSGLGNAIFNCPPAAIYQAIRRRDVDVF
ncbi:hypothetical protein BH11PSE2_BH11PSE2_08910 [soil metagenome]